MATAEAFFVTCDRCGAEERFSSKDAADRFEVQFQKSGAPPEGFYVPNALADADYRADLCGACACAFMTWFSDGARRIVPRSPKIAARSSLAASQETGG